MAYFLSHPLPLFLSRVFHRHLGVHGESTAIPAPEPCALLFNKLIINVEAIAGRAKEGTNATTYALSRYFLPVILIIKVG